MPPGCLGFTIRLGSPQGTILLKSCLPLDASLKFQYRLDWQLLSPTPRCSSVQFGRSARHWANEVTEFCLEDAVDEITASQDAHFPR